MWSSRLLFSKSKDNLNVYFLWEESLFLLHPSNAGHQIDVGSRRSHQYGAGGSDGACADPGSACSDDAQRGNTGDECGGSGRAELSSTKEKG